MSITVTPVLVADLGVEGERMPVYAHVIDHPDARVLVDTGVREPHPLAVDLDPRPRPPDERGIDLASIDIVVNVLNPGPRRSVDAGPTGVQKHSRS